VCVFVDVCVDAMSSTNSPFLSIKKGHSCVPKKNATCTENSCAPRRHRSEHCGATATTERSTLTISPGRTPPRAHGRRSDAEGSQNPAL